MVSLYQHMDGKNRSPQTNTFYFVEKTQMSGSGLLALDWDKTTRRWKQNFVDWPLRREESQSVVCKRPRSVSRCSVSWVSSIKEGKALVQEVPALAHSHFPLLLLWLVLDTQRSPRGEEIIAADWEVLMCMYEEAAAGSYHTHTHTYWTTARIRGGKTRTFFCFFFPLAIQRFIQSTLQQRKNIDVEQKHKQQTTHTHTLWGHSTSFTRDLSAPSTQHSYKSNKRNK